MKNVLFAVPAIGLNLRTMRHKLHGCYREPAANRARRCPMRRIDRVDGAEAVRVADVIPAEVRPRTSATETNTKA